MTIYMYMHQDCYLTLFGTFHSYFDSMFYFIFIVQDPKQYVQTILNVHKKYNVLVVTAFRSDAGFVAALDKVSLALFV